MRGARTGREGLPPRPGGERPSGAADRAFSGLEAELGVSPPAPSPPRAGGVRRQAAPGLGERGARERLPWEFRTRFFSSCSFRLCFKLREVLQLVVAFSLSLLGH